MERYRRRLSANRLSPASTNSTSLRMAALLVTRTSVPYRVRTREQLMVPKYSHTQSMGTNTMELRTTARTGRLLP